MLRKKEIIHYFEVLNSELEKMDIFGEIGICGGAVMCLVYGSRKSTKDIDAIYFNPSTQIREAGSRVAQRFALDTNWMNDAAKGFVEASLKTEDILSMSNLKIWAPTAEYMLAMKCVSARAEGYDRDDIGFLISHLNLKSAEEVFNVITKYYPIRRILPQTQYLVEEVIQKKIR